jgi:hypothetical protein
VNQCPSQNALVDGNKQVCAVVKKRGDSAYGAVIERDGFVVMALRFMGSSVKLTNMEISTAETMVMPNS